MRLRDITEWNYSYFPLVFESEKELLRCQDALKQQEIIPRRYFYPSLNTITYTNGGSCPNSEDIASRILCLPLFADLEVSSAQKIVSVINNVIG
jgi:dTDP-4-amino-4,6-dideoxygalactose transaminase